MYKPTFFMRPNVVTTQVPTGFLQILLGPAKIRHGELWNGFSMASQIGGSYFYHGCLKDKKM